MDEQHFAGLVEDIRTRGLLTQIQLYEGKILDGRNRYRACLAAGIEPRFFEVQDCNPFERVWSFNGTRRDLTADQRYLCFRKCEEGARRINDARARAAERRKRGKTSATTCGEGLGKSSTAIAAVAGVNRGAVERMDRLVRSAPELAEKVRAGELKPAHAMRELRRDEVSKAVRELPAGLFRVIYADPPWKYSNDGAIGDGDNYSRVERHYPPMELEKICALKVRELAADDAVLFMWVTAPLLLSHAPPVLSAWGFTYKTNFVWDKVRHNYGHYSSVRHEHLLVATRGSCMPDVGTLHDSVISIERSKRHSEKPPKFRTLIDALYTNGPRVELFARDAAEGWEAWGNEAA